MAKKRIEKIHLEGFRGAKSKFSVDLDDGKPLLVYGNNGTGKSTIADAIEWFFFDKISHLRGDDFAKKHDGVRNKDFPENSPAYVEINFSDKNLNCTKQLIIKNQNYKVQFSKNEFIEPYLAKAQKENLLIKNDELVRFIVSTKGERLSDISELIGYSEVTKTKQVLRKGVGDIASLLKAKAFEAQITSKQRQLLEIVKSNAYDENQFLAAVDAYVKPLNLNYRIDSLAALQKLKADLEKIQPSQADLIKTWMKGAASNLSAKSQIFNNFIRDYTDFKAAFDDLAKDAMKVKGLQVKSLLEAAELAIEKKAHEDPSCPVCLTAMPADKLLSSLRGRIEELRVFEGAKSELDAKKLVVVDECKSLLRVLKEISENKMLSGDELKTLKMDVDNCLGTFEALEKKFEESINLHDRVQYSALTLKVDEWSSITQGFEKIEKEIAVTSDPRIKIGQSIILAESLYFDINKLISEKAVFERQQTTLKRIFDDFSSLQKEEISKILSSISGDMNAFFKLMNPHEQIDGIELKTVEGADGDFVGIAYRLNFRGTTLEAPQAYMSESYLNCLGLCLFLASVKTFNRENSFFVLDDVISSFDKGHRILFARLLVEQFGDWQPLVLTHEDEWFSYLASLVKGKGWAIKTTKWTDAGSIIETKLADLREEIDQKFGQSDPSGLGNMLGRFTETLLKELCENLEARLPYRPNSYNEDRSFDELFSALRSRLKEKKTGLDSHTVIEHLSTTQFFRNKTSHGNGFGENISDMRVCYDDICKFENLFTCPKGHKISVKYFDTVTSKIRCKTGELQYDWK